MPRTATPSARSHQRQLLRLEEEARSCRRCELWQRGTQTVFGAGPADAKVMLVGEQPGDQEDLAGEPFVGPAGRLLRAALEEAGLDPDRVYLTNAVKHFKWKPVGKRRIHERPARDEILACRFWLDAEVAEVRPPIVVALGATAASVLIGSHTRVLRDRGRWLPSPLAPFVTVTAHPSSILRMPDATARHAARRLLVEDLQIVARKLGEIDRDDSESDPDESRY